MAKVQIEKDNEEVTSIRKNTETDFTLTNEAGETKEVRIAKYISDDDVGGYDNDETIYELNGRTETEITDWEDFILKFAGEDADPDEILDELRDKIEV